MKKIKRVLENPKYLDDYAKLVRTRNKVNKKTQKECYICEKDFKDEDKIGIVFIENDFNKIAHRSCIKNYKELEK